MATLTITVRVMNGRTEKPVHAGFLRLYCRMADKSLCPVMRHLESKEERKAGILQFEIPSDAAYLYQYSQSGQECDFDPNARPEPGGNVLYSELSVRDLAANGKVFENRCRPGTSQSPAVTAAPLSPVPGELVVFYVPWSGKDILKGFLGGPCSLL